jgi:hypothetical protein
MVVDTEAIMLGELSELTIRSTRLLYVDISRLMARAHWLRTANLPMEMLN